MFSPALLIAICLTVYLLAIAVFCQRKLHGVVWRRRLLSCCFPQASCVWCCSRWAPLRPMRRVRAGGGDCVVGIACGPVDMLLFQGLRDACFRAQAAEQVRELEDELTTQRFLRERSAHEAKKPTASASAFASSCTRPRRICANAVRRKPGKTSTGRSTLPAVRGLAIAPIRQSMRLCA